MEQQKTSKSQSNLEKEDQGWRNHNSGLHAVLQSCSHEDGVILAQKQMTHRSMGQNRNPEINPQVYGQLIFDKAGKSIQWKKTVSLANGAGIVGQQHAEE